MLSKEEDRVLVKALRVKRDMVLKIMTEFPRRTFLLASMKSGRLRGLMVHCSAVLMCP